MRRLGVILLVACMCLFGKYIYVYLDTDIPIVIRMGRMDEDEMRYYDALRIARKSTRETIRQGRSGVNKSKQGIPYILHQFWDTDQVPDAFDTWIKSWPVVHPNWEYWFWTEDSVRQLVASHYPEQLEVYNRYPHTLHRANAMRFFVLHRYGGFYADLDVEAIQSVEDWLDRYPCFFSMENLEHTYFHYGRSKPLIMNTVIACRPGHSFIKTAIRKLENNSYNHNTLHTSGPFYLTKLYDEYHSVEVFMRESEKVTLLDNKYFLPTFDPVLTDKIKKACVYTHLLNPTQKLLCRKHINGRWRNKPGEEAVTDHHWFHVNHYSENWKKSSTVDIKILVPSVKIVSGFAFQAEVHNRFPLDTSAFGTWNIAGNHDRELHGSTSRFMFTFKMIIALFFGMALLRMMGFL